MRKAAQIADELAKNGEVRLQVSLVSAALWAKNDPCAFFHAQAENVLADKDVRSDERYPKADGWLDKAAAYHRSIVKEPDE